MSKKYVLGLDISTKTIGVTIMDTDGKLVEIFYISTPKTSKKNGVKDIYDKHDFVNEVFKKLDYDFSYIFIEEPLKNGPNINTTILLAKFNGMVSQTMKNLYGVKPIHITVHDSRKYFFPEYINKKVVKGVLTETLSFPKGKDKKELVLDKVTFLEPTIEWDRRKDLTLKEENYDMSDSYVVCKSGLLIVGLIYKIG